MTQSGNITSELWSPSKDELDWQANHGLLNVVGDTYYFKCIRSGGCCRSNLCPVGELNDEGTQCRHLAEHTKIQSGHQLYSCEIAHQEATKAACQISKGCCMPWSRERNAILDANKTDPSNLIAILALE